MSTYTDTPYQLFPALDRATEDALRESINRWGVIVPIVVDQNGQVIDGHHRQRIARELGVDYGVQQIEVGSEDDARAIAATLNTDRRHMDIDQRRAIVAHLREQGHSLRAIAGAVGVDDKTVRRDLSIADMSAMPETIRTSDGRSYPSTRPAREVESVDGSVSQMNYHTPEQWLELATTSQPHVARNTGENEWYTPQPFIDAAKIVLEIIDLDPASNPIAQARIQASTYYTKDDDGLTKEWAGNVWMNPPYAQPLVGQFIDKLVSSAQVSEAIVLVNNGTETRWGQTLLEWADAVCFPSTRIRFLDPDGNTGAPLQGQMIAYKGDSVDAFVLAFEQFGAVLHG